MSENQVPLPTAVPEAHPNPLEPGISSPPPVLIRHRIVSWFLEGKGVFFEGADEPYDVWESATMMVGWLWIAVNHVNHEVFFLSTPSRDTEGTPCLCDTLNFELGTELNAWVGEQLGRLWSDPNLTPARAV